MENLKDKDLLIVVPYRNREEHLKDFLENTPKYFDNQNLSYDILICELDQNGDWNAGLCVNSLIKFIEKVNIKYKYLYIHHVDVWPISGDWIFPKDNEVYFNMGDYGSCLLTMKAFLDVQGYSNSFWGWGGEDNELYKKLREKQYIINDISDISNIKYETKYQSHQRKFNGKNYANNIKQLMVLPKEKRNNLSNFEEHAYVKNLKNIKNNIYNHIVVAKKESPNMTKNNNKVLLGYIKNVTKFDHVVSYVKSAAMHASYDFDIIIIIADDKPNPELVNELEVFGVRCILRKQSCLNLFIDRYDAYSEFLSKNNQYEYCMHTDVTDVFFQNNPFNNIDLKKIILSTEGLMIKEETWNTNIFRNCYNQSILNQCEDKEIICAGIFAAPRNEFIYICNSIKKESHNVNNKADRGIDQPILNKIIYIDKIFDNKKLTFYGPKNNFAINLHSVVYCNHLFTDIVNIQSNKVINKITNQKYSIVHQYNRQKELYKNITNFYNKNYTYIY
jgi:hypothetical protein